MGLAVPLVSSARGPRLSPPCPYPARLGALLSRRAWGTLLAPYSGRSFEVNLHLSLGSRVEREARRDVGW